MPPKDEDMQGRMQGRLPHRPQADGAVDVALPSREARRRSVLELVSKGGIKSQYDLQDALAERGIEVNQGTLSRDIRALGLLKGKDGYELPANALPAGSDAGLSVYAAVHAWLAFSEVAGTLLVLKTPVAGANPLAIAIDHAGWNEVVGTIAGDDTVFVATRSPQDARRVEQLLLEIKRRRG
jgi:transcriptional regulator of arginine metabolism